MPLKPCRECGKDVSTEATNCPHCGVPNPVLATSTPKSWKDLTWKQWLAAIVVVSIAGMMCSPDGDAPSAPDTSAAAAVASMHPLDQAVLAFGGAHTREQIKTRLDRAMSLYGLPITDENYRRASSVLVGFRKSDGIPEMRLLDHMIRSHVPGVKIDFPSAAAFSVVAINAGDK